MSSQSSEDISVSEKKIKPRRAEREIYRPGALRQLKEVSQSQNEPLKVEKASNDKTKKIVEAKPQFQDVTLRKDVCKEMDRSNFNPKPKSDNLNYKTDNNKPKMSKENLIYCQSEENINRKPENNVSSSETIMKTKVNDDRVSNNNFKSKNKSSFREDSYYYGKESNFRQPYKEEYHKLINKDFNRSFSEESGHKNMKSKGKSYRLNSKEENHFPGKMDKKKENRYPNNSNVSENFKPVKINKENHKEIKMTGSRDNKTIAKTIIKEENPSKMIIKRETCPNSTAILEDFHQTVMSNKEEDKVSIIPNKLEYKRSKKNDIERYKPKQFSDKKISKVPYSQSSQKFIENKYSYENDVEKSKMESKFSSCNTENVSKEKKNSNEHINTKTPSNSRIKETLAKNTYFPDSDANQRDKKEKLTVLKCKDIKNKESNVKNEKPNCSNDKSNKNVNKNDIKLPEKVNHISYKDNSQDCIVDKSKKNIAYSLSPLESSKYAVAGVGGPSSEEAGSDMEETTNEGNRKTVNPMLYIEYKESSFYGNSQKNKISDKGLQRTPQHSSVAWSDEKWAPSQRQKKKKQKNISKDFGHIESPGRRGIIQINNTPSNLEPHAETVVPGQRLLFNPNNPSKPLAVIPSARDLPPSWDHSYGGQEKHEETQPGISSNENVHDNEGSGNVDPSIFYSIQKGELDICYFVNSNQLPQEFKRIMDIRLHLQGCYKQLLISDIRLCQEKNVEGALWKTLYYIIIEKLREYISREPTLKDRSLSTLMMIVEEGLNYFQSLLSDIQKAYRFSLDTHFEEDLTTLPGTKNRVRHALYSCQKIILSMGDLSRYREQYNPNPNYIHAKKWYEMALQVNPKNGRPFNQLAIIAVSQKRSLDVVYYYIRSLTASNPFTSARDSLISMFDDIRRKYESMNKSKQCSESSKRYDDSKYEEHDDRRSNGSLRQEIWIRPDSGATNKRTLSQSDPEEDKRARIEELLKVPHDQLMKQFLTSYLHCHGMLFSRVGLDHFNKVLGETLSVFQALLQANPPKLSSTHLLQILAINMFAVDNTQLRDCRIESSYRSAAQDLALLLSQEMFSRLTEVMVKLFPSCLNYTVKDGGGASGTSVPKDDGDFPPGGSFGPPCIENQRLFQPPLTNFVPAAKVWCDWLLYQSSVWNPPPVSHDLSGVDTWGVIGELATIVKGIGPPDVNLTEDSMSAYSAPVTLPEDSFLRGYVHIVSGQAGAYYVSRSVNKERAQDWIRVKKLQVCLSQFLCGVEPPVLRLQKTDQGEILVAVVAVSPPDSPAVARSSVGSSEIDFEDSNSDVERSDSDDDGDFGSPVDVGGEDTPLASTVRLLARRKKLLEKRQKQQRKMQAILEGAVTLEMEVKPRYLVPDTNCFIEKLNIIKALIEGTSYTFMVPLIVLVELDGLSKDAAVEKYGDVAHAVTVREGAATALHYVQSNKNPRLKCVTSQGSVAPANMFSLEMDTLKDITNDDKILSCCLHLCSDANKRRPIKEGVRRLHREVVLLTEDRNLRVKAYARDVPVRELTDFAHWAGVK